MTTIQKLKDMKRLGFGLKFVAEKTGLDYWRLYRSQRGGAPLTAQEEARIGKFYKAVLRLIEAGKE